MARQFTQHTYLNRAQAAPTSKDKSRFWGGVYHLFLVDPGPKERCRSSALDKRMQSKMWSKKRVMSVNLSLATKSGQQATPHLVWVNIANRSMPSQHTVGYGDKYFDSPKSRAFSISSTPMPSSSRDTLRSAHRRARLVHRWAKFRKYSIILISVIGSLLNSSSVRN